MCHSHPLLPMGLSDIPNLKAVKLYCARCEDIYNPKSSRHATIDGARGKSAMLTADCEEWACCGWVVLRARRWTGRGGRYTMPRDIGVATDLPMLGSTLLRFD